MHLYLCDSRACIVSHAAFAEVSIERALGDEVCTEYFYLLFQHLFVYAAHGKALLAHIYLSGECSEESVCCVYYLDFYPVLSTKIFLHVGIVIWPVDAANVDALEFCARFFEEIRDNRGFRATRERDEDLSSGGGSAFGGLSHNFF